MYSTKFLKFIENAKTPFHAVMGLEEKLIEAGFVKLLESKNWDIALGGKYYVLKRIKNNPQNNKKRDE